MNGKRGAGTATLQNKVELSLEQAMETHRPLKRQGSQILSVSFTHRQPFTPSQKDSWYSFLLEAESTTGPQ
jgi:hypothetical protein